MVLRTSGRPTALWTVPVADLGGVARHVLDTVRAGIPGWRLVLLCPPGPLAEHALAAGGAVLTAPFGPAHGLAPSVRSLRRIVDRLRPRVVHAHLSYADVVAALAVPRGPALVTTEHGIASDDLVYHGSRSRSALMARVHAARLRRCAAVVAVSEATRRAVEDKWHPRIPVRVIRNGVDSLPSAPEPRAGLHILSLARLAPEKRIADLVRAFQLVARDHADAALTVAGSGPLEGDLRALTAQLGLADRVAFPGYVDVGVALATADVVALLSVWENSPYAVLDALVHGAGVVAAPVGGLPEMLPGRCLVPPDSPEEVAAALVEQGSDLGARPTLPAGWPSVPDMTTSIAEVYAEVAS